MELRKQTTSNTLSNKQCPRGQGLFCWDPLNSRRKTSSIDVVRLSRASKHSTPTTEKFFIFWDNIEQNVEIPTRLDRIRNYTKQQLHSICGLMQWFSTGAMPYFRGATGKSRKNGGTTETFKSATKT
jgi:hypothetical protein